jgi:hypothetical protein
MDKVQKRGFIKYNIPSSEPFRIEAPTYIDYDFGSDMYNCALLLGFYDSRNVSVFYETSIKSKSRQQ